MFFMPIKYAGVSGSQQKYQHDCTKDSYLKYIYYHRVLLQVTNTVFVICEILQNVVSHEEFAKEYCCF